MSEQLFNQRLEDEISLKDIFNFLLESWKLIVLSGIVGGLLASGYVFMAPSKYQAVASIQVAKVVNVDVESPGVLMEKLNIPSFYSALTYSACNMTDAFDSGEIIAKNLKPTLSKISNVIYFSYLADSPEDARKCLQGILQDIRNSQNLLANPILEQKKNQMLNLKKRLDTVERVVKVLAEKNSSFNF
jgi:uncharacterized protein involved in exopolysaccharide biosynthesis